MVTTNYHASACLEGESGGGKSKNLSMLLLQQRLVLVDTANELRVQSYHIWRELLQQSLYLHLPPTLGVGLKVGLESRLMLVVGA